MLNLEAVLCRRHSRVRCGRRGSRIQLLQRAGGSDAAADAKLPLGSSRVGAGVGEDRAAPESARPASLTPVRPPGRPPVDADPSGDSPAAPDDADPAADSPAAAAAADPEATCGSAVAAVELPVGCIKSCEFSPKSSVFGCPVSCTLSAGLLALDMDIWSAAKSAPP